MVFLAFLFSLFPRLELAFLILAAQAHPLIA
jgi:hypothetical protein